MHKTPVALLGLVSVALALVGCATQPPATAAPPVELREEATAPPAAWRGAGVETYGVVAASSRLVARVDRAGPLADSGHNHTVATSTFQGCALVNRDGRTWTALRIAAEGLEVDRESDRRAAGESFGEAISPSDVNATRKNMLGADLLNAARFPDIRFSGVLDQGDSSLAGTLTIRGNARPVVLPVALERAGDEVRVRGRTTIRQTDFGITPFSILMGMLQVADEVDVDYRLTFRRGAFSTACRSFGV